MCVRVRVCGGGSSADDFCYLELVRDKERIRKASMGAALPPTGIAALKLAGRHLTSTWISFDSHSEGEDSLMRMKCSNYFR